MNIRKVHSQAKILGTLVTVGGAMIMTLFVGPAIGLPWARKQTSNASSSSGSGTVQPNHVKGALMIAAGNIGYSLFYILQVLH